MFDLKTVKELKYYVYLLLDPDTNLPFYVGKGKGNRVFNHIESAEKGHSGTEKLEIIQSFLLKGKKIKHVIVRHGLNEKTAFHIEAALLDTFYFIPTFKEFRKGNIQGGINSIENGLMSAKEIIGKYNATPLNEIPDNFVIININGSYANASGEDKIYSATKEIWRMSDPRNGKFKYVLSEYRGLIVEVFEVDHWYAIKRFYNPGTKKAGKSYMGYGFNGKVAPKEIRDKYIHKSIAHKKKRGASNPIMYNL
ncbi:hypothetical protein ACFSQP_09320 [Bizionia sediminis]|uniref:GIY-YIG domain-containing protein n=1 Tax=Bizionia sediminis TaxID=1737064 RepID=A0ABW5KUN9_9FLAO